MPKLDLRSIPQRKGSPYPPPFQRETAGRVRQALGDAGGLTQFGVNLLQLPPGAWSSRRHWHTTQDEFVYVVSGEVVLISDDGEEILEVGTRNSDSVTHYPDIDLMFDPKIHRYTRKDGALYPSE